MLYPFLKVMDIYHDESFQYIHFAHQNEDNNLSLVQFGWNQTVGGVGYGPMVRDHWVIHFVYKGAGKVTTSDTEFQINAGECFTFFPHQITYQESDVQNPWAYYWIGLEGNWCPELMKVAGFTENQIVRLLPKDPVVLEYLKNGIDQGLCAENALYLSGLLCQVLFHLITGLRDTVLPKSNIHQRYNPLGNEYVRIVTSIIESSYRERLIVDGIASRIGLNRSYLTTLFKEHTGMSIKQYLMDFRLQQSILRLQRAGHSVKQAALECGFGDPLYFSKAFKARFGISPHEYRDSHSKKQPPEKIPFISEEPE